MTEYVSRLGNESSMNRAIRGLAFLLAAFALFDLAADQLAKALGAIFADHLTEIQPDDEEIPADAD